LQVGEGEAKVPDSKRCRVSAGESPVKPKVEEATASDGSVGDKGAKQGKGKSSKPAVEPPKDYVHVRARRGQATDSHSLAERVNTTLFVHNISVKIATKLVLCSGLNSPALVGFIG
jgi:hypothetical protein